MMRRLMIHRLALAVAVKSCSGCGVSCGSMVLSCNVKELHERTRQVITMGTSG